MSDIAMCIGTECPARNICYRHTAKADPIMQSWEAFHERRKLDDAHCDDFLPLYDQEPTT